MTPSSSSVNLTPDIFTDIFTASNAETFEEHGFKSIALRWAKWCKYVARTCALQLSRRALALRLWHSLSESSRKFSVRNLHEGFRMIGNDK